MKLNRRGFTLVELLVTIVILALVLALSTYGIITAVNDSNDKANGINEKSLFEAARIYSGEVSSDSWKNTDDYEAFCVTIGELMNKGLIEKNDEVNRDDFVIVKRNKITLAIEKEEMANIEGSENYEICTGESIASGETVVKPRISGSTKYTDKLVINFTPGSARYNETDSVVSYDCLYGDSSSSVNRVGRIEGNKCVIENLKNNKDYYVIVYMNTNHGTTAMAEGDKNHKTSDFRDTSFTTSSGNIKLTFYNTDSTGNAINSPSHYFKSSVVGTTDVNVKSCTIRNDVFTCGGANTRNLDSNVWYKVDGTVVNISYASNTDNIDLTTRTYDGSYNYKQNTDNFINRTFSAKFYLNGADSIGGSTSSYVTRTCSTLAGGGSSGRCSITAPSIVRSGWTIVGFNTSSSSTSSSWNVGASKSVSSNVTYYAITRKNFTATFEKNGAASVGSTSQSCTIYNTNTSCTVTSPTITRSGWTIIGWNTSSSGTSSGWNVGTSKTISSDVKYYAITKKNLTASFNKNGATSIGSTSQSCTIYNTSTSCTVTSPTITRSGWTVMGWNTSSSGTSSGWNVNTSKSISSNVTYYAVTRKSLTASFNSNGATSIGSNSLSCYVYNTGTSCTVTSPTITRSGWTVMGWNTSSSGTSSGWNVGTSKSISSNVTYYAITKKSLTASFDKNGATSIGSSSLTCDIYNTGTSCNVTSPTITRSGWSIVGWNTSNSATSSGWNVGASKSISSNVTYYAITKKSLTASFDKNGATSIGSSSLACDIYNTGTSCNVTAPSITRSGWTIVGWNTSNSATSSGWNVGASKSISSNVTYYAITKKSLTATFNKNGATSIGSTSQSCDIYNSGSSCNVTAPTITRSGWSIVGWNTSSSGTSSGWDVGTSKTISSDVTYYAVTRKNLTVTFDKNSATSIGNSSKSCYIYNGNTSCSVTAPTITRSGWTAVGWNTSNSGTSSGWDVGASKSISSDVKYYAITKKALTATFDKNSATSIGSSSLSCDIYNSGTSCNVTAPSITRSGWTAVGWNASNSATSSEWNVGASKTISSDVKYYAITKKSLTASFDKNGATSIGSTSQSCDIYNSGTSCSVTSPTITRSGWTVVGWGTSSGATSSDWNVGSSKSISSNVTYYAVTKGSFTASFNSNGATSIGSSSLSCIAYNNSGCSITAPTITKSGWSIVGWNTSSSATSSGWNVGASKTISSNVTYYAITSKGVTISFNGNGGTAGSSSKSCTMYNGSSSCNITMPSASRSGFVFKGWSTSSSASSGSYSSGSSYAFSSNATLYATWVSNCSGRSGTKEVSANRGFKCRVKWSTSCNYDGTRDFYIDRIEFKSSDYTNVWFKLDGYVYVNDREVLWANSKASGPHISLDWFYETGVWYNIDQDPDYPSVTVSGTTVKIKFDGYNESKFYAINDNYNYAEFYVSSSSVTIDIS